MYVRNGNLQASIIAKSNVFIAQVCNSTLALPMYMYLHTAIVYMSVRVVGVLLDQSRVRSKRLRSSPPLPSIHLSASISLDNSVKFPSSSRRNVTMESISQPSVPPSTTAIPSISRCLMHVLLSPKSLRSIAHRSPLLFWNSSPVTSGSCTSPI